MDMRYNMPMDGRNPYGSRGGYVSSSRARSRRRGSRIDRGMDYPDMNYTGGRGGYPMRDYGNYERDMRGGMDGHHMPMQGGMGGYQPVEAMGYFNGYYGMPAQDFANGSRSRQDYGYDMRGNYRMDYGYDYGDYGETLSEREIEEWCRKLKEELTDQEKQMFSKEAVMQKARALGKPMNGFGEKELYVATLMAYTDDKEFIGQNLDLAVKLGYAFLADKDAKVKGAEKLAIYYDEIVMGGE